MAKCRVEVSDILFPRNSVRQPLLAELLATAFLRTTLAFSELASRLDLAYPNERFWCSKNDIPNLADDAMQQTRLLPNNLADVTREDCRALYRAMILTGIE